jgi:hypothetical protein
MASSSFGRRGEGGAVFSEGYDCQAGVDLGSCVGDQEGRLGLCVKYAATAVSGGRPRVLACISALFACEYKLLMLA